MATNLKSYMAGQLRSVRRQAGLTQAELAHRIGRTDEAISNIERAKSLPSLETLVSIAGALDLPLRDFFPSGSFEEEDVSINRLNKEAEASALLRGLSDPQLDVALLQLNALTQMK